MNFVVLDIRISPFETRKRGHPASAGRNSAASSQKFFAMLFEARKAGLFTLLHQLIPLASPGRSCLLAVHGALETLDRLGKWLGFTSGKFEDRKSIKRVFEAKHPHREICKNGANLACFNKCLLIAELLST